MCVHHTNNYRHDLLRLEFEAPGGVSGWIGKSASDKARSRRAAETPEQREARLARRRQ